MSSLATMNTKLPVLRQPAGQQPPSRARAFRPHLPLRRTGAVEHRHHHHSGPRVDG